MATSSPELRRDSLKAVGGDVISAAQAADDAMSGRIQNAYAVAVRA